MKLGILMLISLAGYCRAFKLEVGGGYSCAQNDPCKAEGHAFYYPHTNPNKFVQCSEWGQCFDMDCPAGLVWDSDALTCNYPKAKPCDSKPCQNGGVCSDRNDGSFTCTCPEGWQGDRCETETPKGERCDDYMATICHRDNTKDNGFYFPHTNPNKFVQCDEWGGCFVMDCPAGLVWDSVAVTCNYPKVVGPCDSKPCQNGGVCSDGTDGLFTCTCPEGWQGDKCETETPKPCDSKPCQNGGVCSDGSDGSYTCTCPEGWQGDRCESETPKGERCDEDIAGVCHRDNTKVNGFYFPHTNPNKFIQCDEWGGCFVMDCPAGLVWDPEVSVCNYPKVGPCDSKPCQNGGVCSENDGSYTCTCPEGWQGDNCETETPKPCDSKPCQNGGVCSDRNDGSFACTCLEGWQGDRCESETPKPCDSKPCQNGGVCSDGSDGSFTCTCPEGWKGDRCEEVDNCVIDNRIECDATSKTACLTKGCCWEDGSCFHGQNQTMEVGTCKFIMVHQLEEGLATYCSNAKSSDKNSLENCLTEACTAGEDVYNAVNMHLKKSCYLRKCQTPITEEHLWLNITYTKHVGRDIWIRVIDYCSKSPCQNGGACKNTERSFTCDCPTGYEGDVCEFDINECENNPCPNDYICTNVPGSYTCRPSACSSGPCLYGGSCTDGTTENEYTCTCVSPYTGKNCEYQIPPCYSTPCENGGTCINGCGDYTCQCPDGYTGKNCETRPCDFEPCQNGATCINGVGFDFECRCTDDYTGTYCEQKRPATCEEAYVGGSTSTGVKTLWYKGTSFKAFCIYNSDRTGWVYFSTKAVTDNATFTLNLADQYTNRSQARVRIFMNDGTQKDMTLKQMSDYSSRKLTFLINSVDGFKGPSNKAEYSQNFLYVGFLDYATANAKTKQGWRVNGQDISFKNCDNNANSYYAFYPTLEYKSNPYGLNSRYNAGNTWRGLINSQSAVEEANKIPYTEEDEFKFTEEIHMGGCGLIEVSSDWNTRTRGTKVDAHAAALGLPFYMSDECKNNPCGSGTCVDLVNSYTCVCDDGIRARSCGGKTLE